MTKVLTFLQRNRQAVCCMALFLICTVAFGGTPGQEGQDLLNNVTGSLVSIVETIVNLLRVVLGIAALITLVIVVLKLSKDEREAAEKIAWWVAGLTVGFVLLTVVKGLIAPGVASTEDSAMAGTVYNLGTLLSVLLAAVSGTALVVTVIYVSQGDRDSAKKLLTWVFATFLGFVFMQSIISTKGGSGSEWKITVMVKNVVKALFEILRVMMVLGSSASLVIVVIKTMKGEREAAGQLLYWVFGLAIGLILLSVVIGLI